MFYILIVVKGSILFYANYTSIKLISLKKMTLNATLKYFFFIPIHQVTENAWF